MGNTVSLGICTPPPPPEIDCTPFDFPTTETIPVTFRWYSNDAKIAYIAGTFSDWKPMLMEKVEDVSKIKDEEKRKEEEEKGRIEFFIIIDLPEGEYEYKFLVDGEWFHDPEEPTVSNSLGSKNNVVLVKKCDYVVSDCRTPSRDVPNLNFKVEHPPDVPYSQEIPEFSNDIPENPVQRERKFPSLPLLLLDTVANADVDSASLKTGLLPPPSSVTLNHLYAKTTRDNTYAFCATVKFRQKYVTTLFYKVKKINTS